MIARSDEPASTLRTPAEPASRRRSASRWVRTLLTVVLGSALLCGAYYYWFFVRKTSQPSSILFANGPQIQEIQAIIRDEPHDPVWRLRLGEAYVRDGHYLTAIEELQAALKAGAPETEVRKGLRTCYIRLARLDLAIAEARRLKELNPDELPYVFALAYAYLEADRREEAVKLLCSIPVDEKSRPCIGKESPEVREQRFNSPEGIETRRQANDPAALEDDPGQQRESLATAFCRAGEWARALVIARDAIRYSPERVGGYVTAGQALQALNRSGEAVGLFKPLRLSGEIRYLVGTSLLARNGPGDRAEAEEEFEEAVRLSPTLGRAWAELGRLRTARGNFLGAAEAYSRADDYGAEKPRARRLAAEAAQHAGQSELAIQLRGVYYQESGQPELALPVYQEILRRHPDQELPYRQVAGALGALNRKQERLRVLLAGQKRFPKSTELVIALAQTYSQLNQAEPAFAVLRQAAEGFARDDAQVLVTLAGALDSSGRMDEAEQLYRRVLTLAPDAVGARRSLAKLLLDRREDPARLTEGVRLLEACVPLARDDAALYHQLGIAYSQAGRTQEAIWALRHAIDLSPGEGITYQPLGRILKQAGKEAEGAEMLRLAEKYRQFRQAQSVLQLRASRTPPNPKAIRALGDFYYEAQAHRQAEREYRRLLELTPGDRDARARLAEIYGILGRTQDRSDLMRESHVAERAKS